MTLTQIEASFFRYLYEELEVGLGIQVLEDINLRDFTGMSRWVVVDTLSNKQGEQPKQIFFLHIATQEQGAKAKEVLTALTDSVTEAVNPGVAIPVYNTLTGLEIGGMEVSETSLSPVMPHASGGLFRSLTVGIVYAA